MNRKLFLSMLVLGTSITAYAAGAPESGAGNIMPRTEAETKVITDMAGRDITVPADIDSVFSRTPMGTVITYALDPALVAGQNWKPTKYEREYLDPVYLGKPYLGGWHATNEGSSEEIISAAPDIMFSSAERPAENKGILDQAERFQQILGIPVVVLDAGIERMPAILRFAGTLTGRDARGEELAAYTERILDLIHENAATIPSDRKTSVYYAEGPEGLMTDPSGSLHSELIDFIGARNAATIEKITGQGGMGRAKVSPEQLLAWDPDIIIACHDQGFAAESSTYEALLNDPRFSTLKAVRTGMVFEVPYKPFNITDRPPSANKIIGVLWLANLVYPEIYPMDIRREFADFYKLFYRIDLDDARLDSILENALRTGATIPQIGG